MPFPTTHPALAKALADRDYHEPTPVQAAVLDEAVGERDLLVSAQTGSGKTVAFGLALASTLIGEQERLPRAGEPLALVVAPTRELAMQVHGELSWLYQPAGARVVSCVGGMDVRREQRALQDGAHIVVGTPGRLRDHLERGRLDVSSLRAVVLDEADEMLDLGFREDLEFILETTPKERRTLLFSATIAREIAALARDYQRDAMRIDTVQRDRPHGDIAYQGVRVAPNDLEHAVVNLLRFHEVRAALVFCSTRDAVRRLHGSLLERGFDAVSLSGEMTQSERSRALQSLRDGRSRVCVATDVAARGLDLPDLGLVIHAELPTNRETLLHRSGRTGRAGKKGISALIVPPNRQRRAEGLIAAAGVSAEWIAPPSAEEIRGRDQARLLADPVLAEPASEEDLALAEALLAERSPADIAAALIRMHRSRLPAPEDILELGPMQDARARRAEARHPRTGDEAPLPPPRRDFGPTVWFSLNVGRRNNADPRWILPLVCRLGHITRKEIGAIRIFDRETRFEIAQSVSEHFATVTAKASEKNVRIRPATADAPAPVDFNSDRDEGPRPPRSMKTLRREDDAAASGQQDRPPRGGERSEGRAPEAAREDHSAPRRPRDADWSPMEPGRPGPRKPHRKGPRFDPAARPEGGEAAQAFVPKPRKARPSDEVDGTDRAPGTDKPYGAKPFKAKPFNAKPFKANAFEAKPTGEKPFGKKPFGAKPFAGKSSTGKPSPGKSSPGKASGRPFAGKPGGKPARD
jgi:ATP-dependent RNA helicase DeaD